MKPAGPSIDESLANTPEIEGPAESKEKCCQVCGKTGAGPNGDKPLKKCSKCQQVFYCSVECQKKDWPTHKLVCKVDPEDFIMKHFNEKTLQIEMFEVIKKLGDGNFTEVF